MRNYGVEQRRVEQAAPSSGGIGFVGLLTILFIGLKLTGYVGWSWWWVLSPIWISFLAWLVFITIFLAFAVLVSRIR